MFLYLETATIIKVGKLHVVFPEGFERSDEALGYLEGVTVMPVVHLHLESGISKVMDLFW